MNSNERSGKRPRISRDDEKLKKNEGKADDRSRPNKGEWKEQSDRKPYQKRDDRQGDKPFRSRDERGGERRAPRRDGDRPYGADRPRRDDRSGGSDRPYGSDRPRRDDRPGSSDRPYGSDRPRRDDRSGGSDRPYRSDKPRREQGDRPFSSDRPRRDDRSGGSDRPFRGNKAGSDDRRPPRRDNDRPYGSDRPRRDDRSGGSDRSFRGDRSDRPRRDGDRPYSSDRPRRDDRSERGGYDNGPRRRYERDTRSRSGSKSYAPQERPESDLIRLNKYLADSGICSRREADQLIAAGTVTVNGEVVTQMGVKVGPTDKVVYGGQALKREKLRYVLLNKPKGFLTTSDDPFDRKTVMELVDKACAERIYPVGRLDRNTLGLLLLTNDGEMAKRLTHPKHGVKKLYHVTLDKALTKNDLMQIADGIELEDGPIKVDAIAWVTSAESKKEVGVELHSGRNRIVRRIFEHLGYKVEKLDRVMFAGITKLGLPRGHWRHLTEKEVSMLRMK